MKTEAASLEPDRTVTLVVHLSEAMEIWHSLRWYERSHRKTPKRPGVEDGKWGHYDCPPKVQPLLGLIKDSIREEQPKFFEQFFGCEPEQGKAAEVAPLP